ncbi:MAG: hypothetical protein KIH63_003015 [Candidatus Saccharibacteria bacterium]|nr:hypothetical protein [Candidatus Saccharibacteria bacterium]
MSNAEYSPLPEAQVVDVHGILGQYRDLGTTFDYDKAPGARSWKGIITGVHHAEPGAPYIFDGIGEFAYSHNEVEVDGGVLKAYLPVDNIGALLRLQAYEMSRPDGTIERDFEADVVIEGPIDPMKALEIGTAMVQASRRIGDVFGEPYDRLLVKYPGSHTQESNLVWQIVPDEITGKPYAIPLDPKEYHGIIPSPLLPPTR